MRIFNTVVAAALFSLLLAPSALTAEFSAGCAKVDITPQTLPAIMNGGFLEKISSTIEDPLFVRAIVLSTPENTIAIAIVDSCMLPRDLCDRAKAIVERSCQIPSNRILIAATHTHSAPSVMNYTLGTRRDDAYADQLTPAIAAAIEQAHQNRRPAQAGWTIVQAPQHTHCRRWLRREQLPLEDPFGDRTVRAMMHPGYQNPEYLMPAGPVDSALTVLSIQTASGVPLCLLSNYSMHYFGGTRGFSADYFGEFCESVEHQVGATGTAQAPFLAAMSQGTSGDLHWMDYSRPKRAGYSRQQYATELADLAIAALNEVEYQTDITLDMAEARLPLQRRQPSADRQTWAQEVNRQRGDRRPRNRPEVYAEQAVWLAENPEAELILQAVRIGDLAIATFPNEVYGITGLKLKAQSPIAVMNFELANGAEGYIPPPEQHYLGGYTTWPARTAGLETSAEPEIVNRLLELLEEVSGDARKPLTTSFYDAEQRRQIERAQDADNNAENRGR